jgi:hypothetical protein
MSDELVTIATVPTPLAAEQLRMVLEAEGIRAAISDAEVAGMNWMLSNAIGGVKVLVLAKDAERAVAVLVAAEGNGEEMDSDEEADEKEKDKAAERALNRGSTSLQTTPTPKSASTPEENEEAKETVPTERELDADRAFRAALFGLLILPLQIYVSWLLLKIVFSEERLEGGHLQRGIVALCVNILLMGGFVLLCSGAGR